MERHAINELRTIMVTGTPRDKVFEQLAEVFAEQLDRIEMRCQETQEKVQELWDQRD